MAFTYRQVKDLYDTLHDAGVTQASLPDWADEMNRLTQSDIYSAGRKQSWVKDLSVGLDRLLERTGLPEKTGEFGAAAGRLIGGEEQGRAVGESLPRMAVEFAPMFIPGGGWAAAAAKFGLTGLLSGARTYTETDSPAAGVLSAATNMAMPGIAGRAEQLALRAMQGEAGRIAGRATLEKGIETVNRFIPQTRLQGLGSLLAGQGAASAAGELSGFGQQALADQPIDFDWRASVLGMTVGQLPFALPYLTKAGRTQFGGRTSRELAESLRANIKATEGEIARQAALVEARSNSVPLSEVPDVEQLKISPTRLAEVNSRLEAIRGRMAELKEDPTSISMEEWNKLSKEENDLIAEQGFQPDAVAGQKLNESSQRVVLEGKEVFQNKTGTYRIIELPNGDRYGYSTRFEPQAEDLGNGLKRFSLPKDYMSKVTDKYAKQAGDPTQPSLPTGPEVEPNFDHVKAFADAEAELGTAKTAADFFSVIQKINTVRELHDLKPLNDGQIARRKKLLKLEDDRAAIQGELNRAKRQVKLKLSPEDKERAEWDRMPETDRENIKRALVAKGGEFEDLSRADADNSPLFSMMLDRMDQIVDNNPEWKNRLAAMPEAERQSAIDAVEKFKIYAPLRMLGDLGDAPTLTLDEATYFNSLLNAEGIGVSDPKELVNFPQQVSGMAKLVNSATQVLNRVSAPRAAVPALSAGAGWIFSMGPYDPATNTLNGKHKLPKDGNLGVEQFRNMAGVGSPISKAEVDLYKVLVPGAFDPLFSELENLVAGKPVKVYHGAEKGKGYNKLPAGRYTSVSKAQAKRYPFEARGQQGENEIYVGQTTVPAHLIVVKQAEKMLADIKAGRLSLTEARAKWDEGLREYQLDSDLPVSLAGEERETVNVPVLVAGLKERGPVVKTEEYGMEGKATTPEKAELDQLRHEWFDNLTAEQGQAVMHVALRGSDAPMPQGYDPRAALATLDPEKVKRFIELRKIVQGQPDEGVGPRATSYYKQISPFDTEKYPVLRVDVVLPKAGPKAGELVKSGSGIAYRSAEDQALWPPDNLHENLPNTLGWAMVQFVPLNGETVMFIGEQQSRWGQELQRVKREQKDTPRPSYIAEGHSVADKFIVEKSHPLLDLQHTLVLKAAIAEAKKRGVSKIVVSDGESAMMTEGHDKFAQFVDGTYNVDKNWLNETLELYADEGAVLATGEIQVKDGKAFAVRSNGKNIELNPNDISQRELVNRGVKMEPSQSGGMRLHYDTTLPSAMEKLTGDKGERVEMGVHKNATYERPSSIAYATEAEALAAAREQGLINPTARETIEGWEANGQKLKGSPVFRNPDGTPKSSATGRVFDLTKAFETLDKQGGAFTLTAKNRAASTGGLSANEVPYVSSDPHEQKIISSTGTTGKQVVDHLFRSKNPLLVALAEDLAQYPEVLDRIKFGWFEMPGASYSVNRNSRTAEIRMQAAMLGRPDTEMNFEIAHELLHGITQNELDNPAKREIVDKVTALRERLIESLPADMRKAYDKAVKDGWYQKHSSGDTQSLLSLHPNEDKANVLYALFNNHELVAQGFSSKAVREYLQRPSNEPKKKWIHKFIEYVKQLTGLGEKIPGTAFEELLSLTSQIARTAEASASFSNFADVWFQDRGFTLGAARAKSQQALGLVINSQFGTSPAELFTQLATTSRVSENPEVAKARNKVIQLAKSDEFAWDEMHQVLSESAIRGQGFAGLDNLVLEALDGRDVATEIQLLPGAAQNYIFARLSDWRETLDVVRAATSAKNKGIAGITDPALLRQPIKDSIKAIDKVLAAEAVQEQAIQSIASLLRAAPDAFLDNVVEENRKVRAPGVPKPKSTEPSVVELVGSVFGKLGGQWVENTLGKPAQLARSNPVWAEAFSLGSMMQPLAQHSARESLNFLGHKIENGQVREFSDAEQAKVYKLLENQKVRKVLDKWLELEQQKGKDKVVMLTDTDPDVAKLLTRLTPAERQDAVDFMNKLTLVNADKNRKTLSSMQDIAVHLGARIILAGDKGKLQNALTISRNLFDAVTADFSNPGEAARANALLQQLQSKMSIETFSQVLRFVQNEAKNYQGWQKRFADNPHWASARRIGKFTFERMENGKWVRDAAESEKEAKAKANGQPIRNLKQRENLDDVSPTMADVDDAVLKQFQEYERNRIDMLRESGLASPELIDELERLSPAAMIARDAAAERAIDPTLPPNRKLSRLSEDHPWLLNHITGIYRNATYWSRRATRIKAETLLTDPELDANPELKSQVKKYFEGLFYPDPQAGQSISKFAAIWGLGFNAATSIANVSQTPMRLLPELIRLSGSPVKSMKLISSALGDYLSNRKSQLWRTSEEQWFMNEAANLGQIDATIFDVAALQQDWFAKNYEKVLKSDRPKTFGNFVGNLADMYTGAAMVLFRKTEQLNNNVGLLSAYRMLKELNPDKPKEWLRDQAFIINSAVNDTGGRANRPVGIFHNKQPFTRNLAMVFNSLQSYTLGSTHQLIRYFKEGGFSKDAKGLKPSERWAATKAAVTMLSVQFGAAGALGLPFATAALTLLDKAFPELELRRKLRENMASFFRDDQENGSQLTDMFMSGIPSMLGWDMQSRLSMGNNLPGVNEFNGFDPVQLLGAPAGMVKRFLTGATQVASGDMRGGYAFVPPAFKKLSELLVEGGKVVDYKNRPVLNDLTPGEGIGLALGFNPTRLSKFNQTSLLQAQADTVSNRREAQFRQRLAEDVLQGKFGTVRQELNTRKETETDYDVVAAAKAVAVAAEELTFPRDLRREGTARNAGSRSKLLSVMGIEPGTATEEERLRFRLGILQRLGVPNPVDSSAISKAKLMDQLRIQNPEATRSELRRAAEGALRRSASVPRALLDTPLM